MPNKQILTMKNFISHKARTGLLFLIFGLLAQSGWGQISYTSTAATTAWNASRWNNSSDASPYASAFTANNAVNFTSGTYTFAGMGATTNVGNVTVASGVTVNFASIGFTYGTGGAVRTINVGSGGLFDFNGNSISTAAGTGFIKTGAGIFATGGGNFTGGFTLNAGTVIARGTTGLGSGTGNILTLNGGTIASNDNRIFNNTRFPGGIVIGGNIQFGEIASNVALADPVANLSFANNISLGGSLRTLTLGNGGNIGFDGVISNTGSNGLTFTANSNGTGRFDITGTNTFSGPVNINGNGTGVAEVRFTSDGSLGNTSNTININGGRLSMLSGAIYTLTSSRGIQVGNTAGTSISTSGSTSVLTYNGVISDLSGATPGAWAKQGSGTLSLGGLSTYTGATSINNGTLQLTTGNDRLPTGTVLSLGQALSTNLGILDLNGRNQTIAGLNSTIGSASALTNVGLNNTITSTASATLTLAGSGTYGDATDANSGIIAGAISLVKSGTGTLTLGDGNTYTGTTTISSGTLTLSGLGSIATSPTITVGSSGTFDVSGLTTALTLGASQTLRGSATGSNTTGTIKVATSKDFTVSAGGLTFTALAATTTPPLTVDGTAGNLVLVSGCGITVPNNLTTGTYRLIAKSGNGATVSGTAGTLTYSGSSNNTSASVAITSGELVLTVIAAPTLTAATLASAISNVYGTASTGVSFSASGSDLTSNITATAQTGFAVSTDNSTFSSSVSVESETTVYVQSTATKAAGTFDGATAVVLSGGGAASSVNITTSASGNAVSAKALTVTASAQIKTAGASSPSTGTLDTHFSVSGLVNSDTANQVTLSYSGSPAGNLGTATAGDYTITPSALTFASGSSSNYSITYNTGTLTINAATTPTLTAVTLGSALSSTYGTASTGVSFAVGGSNLSTSITATPQAGYEISSTLNGTYQSVAMSGIADGSTLYVRFASTKAAGSHNDVTAVVLSGGGAASDANVTTSASSNTVSKATPTISAVPTATAITYGQTLASSTLSGGTASVAGTFAFTSPSTAPNAGTADQSVTFTPTDTTNYNTTTANASVTVNKANQTITFGSLASQTTATVIDYSPGATSATSVTNAITYTSSNTLVATIVSDQIHIVGAGTTTITASQAASSNYNAAADVSQILTVTQVSVASDYFRSMSSGNWNATSSWESSPDNTSWIASTLTPTSTSNTITIRNGHTIANSSAVTIDQVIVQSGGILTLATGGAATIVNGSGDDIIIQNGGRINYQLAPTYNSSTIRINGGGILSIEVSGVTASGTGVNASTHIYDDAAILQWNLVTATPSANGVTFFPNVTTEIPILRFASGTASAWGATNSTIVNGKVEITSGVTISLSGSATKTFKYGITGSGILNQSNGGQIIFSGSSSEIGDTTTVNLGTNGLSVTGGLSVSGTLVCGTNLVSGAGAFTLTSGATLKTASPTGVTGSITLTGTKTLSSAANYEFNGAATGTFTTTPTANTVNNLTINRSDGVTLSQNLAVAGALTQTSGKLSIGGFILTLKGTYSGDATNSLTGSATSNLTLGAFLGTVYFDQTTPGTTNVLKNLTLSSGSATLGNALNITAGLLHGILSVGASATLTTGGNLTLKSDANGTARVSAVGTGGAITGNVTVERYIPAKRAWRALTAPLKGSNTTLYNSWQNGGTAVSPYNTGIELWGPSGTGMATGPAYNIRQYTTSGWADVTNTQSTNLFTSGSNNAYLVFVTGGYGSNNIGNGQSAATTLKATGQLITGPVSFAVTSARHTLVGNPFASPISPSAILAGNTQANLYTNIWLWDPAVSTNGVYVNYDASVNSGTFSDNSGSYTTSSTAIQSGQAFFVKAVAGTDTLTLTESMKSSSISNTFRNSNNITASVVRLGFAKQIGTDWMPLDGAIAALYNNANAAVDVADGTKMVNTSENIAFVRGTTNLSIEHYPIVNATDQLNVKIWNTQQAHYKLKLNTEEFTMVGVEAWLQDLYTGTSQQLNLDGSVQEYEFDVDPTVSASSGTRFRIVFTNTALAVDTPTQGQLSIYPNPATGGKVTVSLPTGNFEGCSYELINVLGQVVQQDQITNSNSSQVSIPITGLPNSWYALRIIKENSVMYQGKLIIKN